MNYGYLLKPLVMEKAAMIFNGIYLSYAVVDEAFAWAKSAHANLLAVFLSSKQEKGEGYLFPSDLDGIANSVSDTDARIEDEKIIQSNARLLEHQAVAERIALNSVILVDPSEKELSAALNDCTQIFIHDNIQEPGIVTVESIKLDRFLKSTGISLKIIRG